MTAIAHGDTETVITTAEAAGALARAPGLLMAAITAAMTAATTANAEKMATANANANAINEGVGMTAAAVTITSVRQRHSSMKMNEIAALSLSSSLQPDFALAS